MLNFNPIPHLFTGKRTLNRLSKFYEVLSYERINRDFTRLMKVYVFIFICFYIIYLPAMEYDPVAELFTVSLHILTFYCKVLLNHPVVFLSFLMGSWYQPILYPNNIDTLLGKIIPLVLYCKRKKNPVAYPAVDSDKGKENKLKEKVLRKRSIFTHILYWDVVSFENERYYQ